VIFRRYPQDRHVITVDLLRPVVRNLIRELTLGRK
jgi:hypothetical protein